MHLLSEIIFTLLQKLIRVLSLYKLAILSKIYDGGCWLQNKPKVLILGSSFAMTSIVPHQIVRLQPQYKIEDIANFGQSMGGPYEMYISCKKNSHLLDALEYVYIGLDPHILGEKFFHYMHVEKQLVSLSQWKYLFENHARYMEKYHPQIQIDALTPFVFVKSIFTNHCKEAGLFRGYKPRYYSHIKSYEPSKIASYTYEPLELFPVSEFSIFYLKELSKLIEANSNAKIRYMLSPSYDWQEGYERFCKAYDTQLTDLLQKSLGDIEIIGSLYKEDFGLKKYDFFDNRHLSHMGALKYTSALFSDMAQVRKAPLQALTSYRMQVKTSLVIDSFTKNLEFLKKELNDYMQDKQHVVLFGFTNLSRCIMSLLDATLERCVVCDSSLYLGTAPEFLVDSFVVEKCMLHVSELKNHTYDGVVICNFMKWEQQHGMLLKHAVQDAKIFSLQNDGFDRNYFHMQVNMVFSLVNYLASTFKVLYIVDESLALTLVARLLAKRCGVVLLHKSDILEATQVDKSDTSAYVMSEMCEDVVQHLQDNCEIDFENIIILRV
jgi:hypothetical protein